jgi:AcrR family transcriptional regulator
MTAMTNAASTKAASTKTASTNAASTNAASTKAASTRAAILERAVDIASVEGLEGLTIGRLASELQMSKSGLFAHFGSKQDLQLATLDAAAQRFYAAVIVPAQAQDEGYARLRAYCDGYLDYLEHKVFAGGCFWAGAAAEFDDRPGAVRDAVSAGVLAWLSELEHQAAVAGIEGAQELAFELYSLGLGANACSRLLGDERAFVRARSAIEHRLREHQ